MKSGNKGRTNSKDNYRDRASMKGEQEYMGEDVGDLGQGKGADRKRLMNEIDDNAYDAQTTLEIVDDPRAWGEDLQLKFVESVKENYAKNLKKYVRMIKKTYDWIRSDDELAQSMTSIVAVRAAIGMSRAIWLHAEGESEEFLHYSNLIKDVVSARISHLGMTDSKGQIFKIFSIKNILPDDYSDKKEVSHNSKIEVIQIGGGGDKKQIEQEINKNKKRLNK